MYNSTTNFDEFLNHEPHGFQRRPVYLPGSNFSNPSVTKVAPAPFGRHGGIPMAPIQQFQNGVVYESMKPIIYLVRGIGILPVGPTAANPKVFRVTATLVIYSVFVFLVFVGFIGYLQWDKVEIIRSAEAKFEEAVIDYLFSVYLLPIALVPLAWYEARKMARVFSDWGNFEDVYKTITDKTLPLFVGNKPLLVTLAVPIISCATMVVTHITMVDFKILQIVPYCYVNTITYLIGGIWYVHCDVIARVAALIAKDFEKSLHHVGPSQLVAEYRAMWMLLAKIIRNVGMASCFTLIFLSLYLFLVITLTIYGLLSKLQEGFGLKDIGLVITSGLAVALLYFVCDQAHYASNSVKSLFQKKLLLVELSWMSEDAQQEIQMFLRATEMNETSMSVGGFFDVNRTLFKSLLSTMVTYLVVLLQFQISIPEDTRPLEVLTTTVVNLVSPAGN